MRSIVHLFAALLFAAGSSVALAQVYPAKPVRVLIPLPPGSPAEIAPRAMAEALGKAMGQAFVVDNRPGADGFIASEACARAAPGSSNDPRG